VRLQVFARVAQWKMSGGLIGGPGPLPDGGLSESQNLGGADRFEL